MKIATLNFYDIPLSFRNKRKDFNLVENFFLNEEIDLFFIQELNFLKPKSNKIHISMLPGIISRSGGLCVLSKVALEVRFIPFVHQRIRSSFMTIGDSILKKGFQYFRFNGTSFINVHLASTYKNTQDENRLISNQLTEVQEFIRNIKGPLVICGDFNIPPNHPSVSKFIIDNVLTDFSKDIPITLSTENTNRQTFIHDKLEHLKDIRVDYILGRNVTINNCSLAFNGLYKGKHISDHFGLIADIN